MPVVRVDALAQDTLRVQAGLEVPKPDARASSTALGYNQLLSTNTVEILAENGDRRLQHQKKAA